MEFFIILFFVGLAIWGIAKAIEEAKSSPEAVAKDASRYNKELRDAMDRSDVKRSTALLQALPRWPVRESLIAATVALQKLRAGAVHASASGVPDATTNDIEQRSANCENALCLVAVRVLAARLQSEQSKFKLLPERSRVALLRDAEEIAQIAVAAQTLHEHMTDIITNNRTGMGAWSLQEVGTSMAALSAAASRIVAEGDLP